MIRTAAAGLLLALAVVALTLLWLGFSPRQMAAMFAHPVAGGVSAVAPGAPAPDFAAAQPPRIARAGLSRADYAVIAVYLAGILAVGWLAGRGVRTCRGLFLGDGRLHPLLVGVSLLGTYLSALTVMALPGMAFGAHDWTYMVQLPCLLITGAVITGVVLPRYRAAGVVSIYEYLETRLHVSVRLLAAVSFLVFAVGRLGLVLYLPALAVSTVTGFPLPACVVVIGVVVTAYTARGGLRAAVWTDLVQVVIFISGAFLTLWLIFADLGAADFLRIGLHHQKFRLLVLSPELFRITTWWLVLETLVQTVRIYGTQQDMAQLYLSTPSTAKAARSVWLGILLYIPLGFLFYFIGTALFAFYQAHPDPALPAKADQVYPFFIVHHLPPGVAGLLLAAILAASMSSIDSCMNSASTVCIEDFLRRFSPRNRSDGRDLRLARGLILLWGVLMVVMGLLFMRVHYAQIVWGKVMGFCTNGVLGLLLLALLPFRVDWRAVVIAFVVSYGVLCACVWAGITFLLWPVFGNGACFAVALLLHAALRARGRRWHAAREPVR